MKIVLFEEKYRDDMIFMVPEAKNALGRVPRLNDDLLDVKGCYSDKGDAFWIALDENDRVIGCIGYSRNGSDARLHRLYVKCGRKRQGIGSALLLTAERDLAKKGVKTASVHLGDRTVYSASYAFYPKHGYAPVSDETPDLMQKTL